MSQKTAISPQHLARMCGFRTRSVNSNFWTTTVTDATQQTTDNACATIALLNIIMNAEGLGLGEKLRRLKQESKDLSPPLRGNMITNSAWIRTAHNSFAR